MAAPQNRDKNGRFIKGSCPNPGGRPKVPENVKEAFSALAPHAVETIGTLMRDKDTPAKVRLDAATYVVDRVYGRPKADPDSNAGALEKLDQLLDGITNVANNDSTQS